MHVKSGMITAKKGTASSGDESEFSYKNAPITPLIPPIYIIPGIPRLRLPDFSVIISPVEPYKSGMPCIMALWRKATIVESILLYLLF